MASAKLWLRASRPFSFTASVTPVLLGTALAWYRGYFNALYFLAALLGALLLHAGSNLIGDYFDYKKQVDREGTLGGSGVLVEGLLRPKAVFIGGLTAFAGVALIGVYLIAVRGIPILVLGLTGLLGGFFYTADPVEYKYKALGDVGIFLLFGPLIVLGADYVQTGQLSWLPVWVSLPIALLVTGILHSNNFRDIRNDAAAGIKTFAMVLGEKNSVAVFTGMIALAYLLTISLIIGGIMPLWSLMVLLSLPSAFKVLQAVQSKEGNRQKGVAAADVMTARLHMQFGVLLTLAFVLEKIM
ncbi:MAG TPA: 1,4-dihydroxy-2-naphthoate octaprenyltransferase [Bacteroidetes bacterium]|nr:1,4-dihydroxy-2-naphthoate octaprenyltransferase [Bacteroidota bacterium]